MLRGIAFLVRDKNWGTYAPAIAGLKVKQTNTGFTVSYSATCQDKDQGIHYTAKIESMQDGTVVFSATGTPLSDFVTNRTGFVVLHPLVGLVGEPVEIVHTDGKCRKSKFPKLISPGQPVFEIRSLKHNVLPGVTATVLMEGNKFEMEDHRNWMDASYKTYVCSLLDPWPYTLKKGEAFTQSITLKIEGRPKQKLSKGSDAAIGVVLGSVKGRIPTIGVGVPMLQAAASLEKADLIKAANPSHLICQIDGRLPNQSQAAAAFRNLKQLTGKSVTLEIILPAKEAAENEVEAIAKEVKSGGLIPDAVVITHVHDLKSFQPNTSRPWGPSYEEMAAAVRRAFQGVTLGGGMLSYFTELNRKPAPMGVFDFITHTVCPIVHAADDISVMETLESLPSIFASARAIIGKSPYHLGPSSIPCRDNPYGAAVAANPGNSRVCLTDTDPRQRGLMAAAWNLGLVAAAARGGIDAMALGAATGPQGIIYNKANYSQPWFDESGAAVYPAFHVLAGLGAVGRAKRIEAISSKPSSIETLAYQTKTGPVLWLVNLTAKKQKVKIGGFDGGTKLHMLDIGSFNAATGSPDFLARGGTTLKKITSLDIGPYWVARITSL